MPVWARMVLTLSWGALSVNQVALGNNYSTARDGEGELWRCVEEKGSGFERLTLTELTESGNLFAGAQLRVHVPRGTGKFLWDSEGSPWRRHLPPGPRAQISSRPLSRSLAVHHCHSRRGNPQECLGRLLSAKNRVHLRLDPGSLQGPAAFGILDSLPLAWRSWLGQGRFPVQRGASLLRGSLNVADWESGSHEG